MHSLFLLFNEILTENRLPPDRLEFVLEKYATTIKEYMLIRSSIRNEGEFLMAKDTLDVVEAFINVLKASSHFSSK